MAGIPMEYRAGFLPERAQRSRCRAASKTALWLLLIVAQSTVLASAMPSRNSSPAAKKASFKTPDDKPKPKSGLQRSGTKVASKAAQKSMDAIWEQVEALEAEGRFQEAAELQARGLEEAKSMFDDKREQVNEKQKKVTQQWLLPAACCARGKKPLFEFETPLLDGVIEEYFANGALERRWVAVREGADALREKATELAQPLTELISPAKPKSKDDELDAAAALIQGAVAPPS